MTDSIANRTCLLVPCYSPAIIFPAHHRIENSKRKGWKIKMSENSTDDKIIILGEATIKALDGMGSEVANFLESISDRTLACQLTCGALMAAIADRSDNPIATLRNLQARTREALRNAVFEGMEPERAEATRGRVSKVIESRLGGFTLSKF
jgi:hypothetical protein